MSELYAAIDIGTSKIATVIAKMSGQNTIEVLGIGRSQSRGMKKGLVVDVNQLSEAIRHSVQEAEDMADCSVDSVFAGISGDHIKSIASRGIAPCNGMEINEAIKLSAIESAKGHELPSDYQLLHAIPRHYSLDSMTGIKEPDGMFGTRLEAEVLLISCSTNALLNINNCLRRCKLNGTQYILEHIASSEAVLSEDEKELGVCLVDIGGGTTDIAVFLQGSLAGISIIPVAGDHVTHDITNGLRMSIGEAEDLKIKYGTVISTEDDANKELQIPGLGGRATRRIAQKELVRVIRARYQELFGLVLEKLQSMGYDLEQMISGVVLTGGSCQIIGAVELAEEVFKAQVRIGYPVDVRGASDILNQPNFSTTVGLLQYGYKQQHIKQNSYVTKLRGLLRRWIG